MFVVCNYGIIEEERVWRPDMQYQDQSEPANTRQNMFNLTLRLWSQKIELTQKAHGIDKCAAGFDPECAEVMDRKRRKLVVAVT